MRRVAHAFLELGSWVDPRIVKLEMFRLSDHDSPFVLWRRCCYAHTLVSALEKISGDVTDCGAGATKHHGVLWLKPERMLDHIKDLDYRRDTTSDSQMKGLTGLLHETMHRVTFDGRQSASTGFLQLNAKLPEMLMTQKALYPAAATAAGPSRAAAERRAKAPAPRTSGDSKPANASNKKKKKEQGKARFADAEGEKGPNGLSRKVGGNDAGAKCAHVAKGETCPYKTCSYSHK